MVPDEFKFETFVEAQGTAMQEYLSSVVAKLSKTDKAHRAIQDKIESIYRQYPHVMGMFDTEKAVALTEQECAAAIEVVGLQKPACGAGNAVGLLPGLLRQRGLSQKSGHPVTKGGAGSQPAPPPT